MKEAKVRFLSLYLIVLHLTLVRNVTYFPILIWQKWTEYCSKVLTALSQNHSLCQTPEVLAEVTEQPRFLPWEFDPDFFT